MNFFAMYRTVITYGIAVGLIFGLGAGCSLYQYTAPDRSEGAQSATRFVSAQSGATRAERSPLRVVSYNVALGYGLDAPQRRLMRLSRDSYSIRSALKKHPALRGFDILGVQEVCSDRGGAQLESLQKLYPGFAMVFGRSDLDRVCECAKGQAIVSRYPIEDSGTLHLPQIRKIGRSAVWADVRVPSPQGGLGTLIRVYNIHLDNRGVSMFAEQGRWVQMQAILKHINTWKTSHPHGEVIVLGDFNSLGELYDPWRGEQTIAEMLKRFNSAIPEYESTHVLSYQLDWIFYPKSSRLRLRKSSVVDIVRSDHFPVVADFDLYHRTQTVAERDE